MTGELAFPPFEARAPWWGGDLQTMRNLMLRKLDPNRFVLVPDAVLELALSDGDRLIGMLNEAGQGRPLAVLIHGLTGCHESSYMVESARHLLGLGYSVLRLNLRGAGPSAATCRARYHAGRGEDIADALAGLDPALLRDGVVLVGYSLGANILLNFLVSHGADFPVRAAASVSAPIDLAACSRRMLEPRNRLYHRYLLGRMCADWKLAALSDDERATLGDIETIYEFDDRLVAPGNGFGTADRYYAECSGLRVLGDIPTPTLLIQAADDPWIPAATYRDYDWSRNPRLTPLLAGGGGHVGFHGRGGPPAWHDSRIGAFFGAILRVKSTAA